MTTNELQSKTIDWLRFPLAVAVVFIHIDRPLRVGMQEIDYSALSGMDIYSIIATLGSLVLANIAVPSFFLFSGFLFFHNISEWNRGVYLSKIKSRFKTLLVPYLLWGLIYVFTRAFLFSIKMDGSVWIYFNELYDRGLWRIFWNYLDSGARTNLFGWLLLPTSYPYLKTMWFVRDLIIISFLSPLIYYFVKRTKIIGIILLGVLFYAGDGFLVVASFFFSLGAYFSIHGKNMVVSLRKGQLFWLLLAAVSAVLSTYFNESEMQKYFSPLYVVSGVITAINITSFFLKRKKIKVNYTLSKASFFIYAVHIVTVLYQTQNLYDKVFHPTSAIGLSIRYICAPLICVGVCLGIFCLMRRFVPKILGVLTGNRVDSANFNRTSMQPFFCNSSVRHRLACVEVKPCIRATKASRKRNLSGGFWCPCHSG